MRIILIRTDIYLRKLIVLHIQQNYINPNNTYTQTSYSTPVNQHDYEGYTYAQNTLSLNEQNANSYTATPHYLNVQGQTSYSAANSAPLFFDNQNLNQTQETPYFNNTILEPYTSVTLYTPFAQIKSDIISQILDHISSLQQCQYPAEEILSMLTTYLMNSCYSAPQTEDAYTTLSPYINYYPAQIYTPTITENSFANGSISPRLLQISPLSPSPAYISADPTPNNINASEEFNILNNLKYNIQFLIKNNDYRPYFQKYIENILLNPEYKNYFYDEQCNFKNHTDSSIFLDFILSTLELIENSNIQYHPLSQYHISAESFFEKFNLCYKNIIEFRDMKQNDFSSIQHPTWSTVNTENQIGFYV